MFGSLNKRGSHSADTYASWTGSIFAGADALRKRKDLSGQTLRFPTGEAMSLDNSGGLIVTNSQGQIVKTVSRTGAETSFSYTDIQLSTVEMHNGRSYMKNEHGLWFEQVRGARIVETNLEFRVLLDGTLRVAYKAAEGRYHDYRLDGTAILVNEKGRISALSTGLEVQHARIYATLDNMQRERLIDAEQRQAICDAMHSLSRRVALEEITSVEAGKTMYHVGRLLEASGRSPLSAQQCFMLAHEVLFFSACPEFAENTDALSCFIQKLLKYHPSHVAMLVAEMSIYKRYVTAGGWLINYVEELMNPRIRRNSEWTCSKDAGSRFMESNRFLRVVLVNVVERLRLAERSTNVALLADHRRMFTTREFGRVFGKDLNRLWQEVTGFEPTGLDFSDFKTKDQSDNAPEEQSYFSQTQSGTQLPRARA